MIWNAAVAAACWVAMLSPVGHGVLLWYVDEA